jgi:hypothetical protein
MHIYLKFEIYMTVFDIYNMKIGDTSVALFRFCLNFYDVYEIEVLIQIVMRYNI